MPTIKQEFDFDRAALRKKYDEECKRLRNDGNREYIQPKGQLAHYLDVPCTERKSREPITKAFEVVILGGDFGGLLTAARLRKAGIALDDFTIIGVRR